MSKKWAVSGNQHYIRDISGMIGKLEPGVYKLEVNPATDEFYLALSQEKFEFPYKIYNKDEAFVNRVKKTWDNTTGNLGILLNGVKGTGKTVTAELICNAIGLPVVIVSQAYNNMPSFFNDIQQDIIVFFDEFEKIFDKEKDKNAGGDILSIMDGAMNGIYRKVFLLTTNEVFINSNLLQRPSRIRYFRTYEDLDLSTITEIVNDKLKLTEFKDDILKFSSELKMITIDIVKAIIDEVNIHGQSPYEFSDFFNVEVLSKKRNIFKIEQLPNGNAIESMIANKVIVNHTELEDDLIGESFYYKKKEENGWKSLGSISRVIDENTFEIEGGHYDDDDNWIKEKKIYKLEEVSIYHSSFKSVL